MKRDNIRAVFDAVRESEQFVLVTPNGQERIYGKARHNMPHGFYAGFKGSSIVMACEYRYEKPYWFSFDFHPFNAAPSVLSMLQKESAYRERWPYTEGAVPIHKGRMLTIEDVMNEGPDGLKEFIIFNLNILR
jgi:hypothetical protein